MRLGFPDRRMIFVGDAGYCTHEVARFAHRYRPGLTLVSKLHPDANLFERPPQGLRTRISRLGTLGKLGLPLLYSQAGQQSYAFCSIDRQDHTTSSGTSAP